jgi:hypothetical protein
MQPLSKQSFPAAHCCRFWPDIYVCTHAHIDAWWTQRTVSELGDLLTKWLVQIRVWLIVLYTYHSEAYCLVHNSQWGLLSCPHIVVGMTVLYTNRSEDYCLVHKSQRSLLSWLQIIGGAYCIVHRSKVAYCLVNRSQWGSPYCPQTIVGLTILCTNHVGDTRGPWGLPRYASVADNARYDLSISNIISCVSTRSLHEALSLSSAPTFIPLLYYRMPAVTLSSAFTDFVRRSERTLFPYTVSINR